MSMQHTATMGKPVEDCRDYLRTGRCKYGASCKYSHPANVLNGGGVKPLDPSEPMFPIRPNEPICQYYIKHGTCKFGQACKFHHPPAGSLGSASPMGFTNRRPDPAPQLLLNPVGTDPNGQGMMLQFLPQRPDEPDCIYFLKNGRCKYGATCRYHHPIHPHVRRAPDRRRQPVQYVTHVLPSYSSQVGQVVVTSQENPVAYINVDGGTATAAPSQSSYQIIQGGDGVSTYCLPQGSVLVTDQGSSVSSMASSYEAAQDHFGDSQWGPRPQRNGSGGSLNEIYSSRQQRAFLPHVSSEGSISQRRSQAAPHGSSGDHSASYFEVPSQAPVTQRTNSVGSWSQRVQGSQFRQESSVGRIPAASTANRRVQRQRSPRGHQGSDEGFTMMTSALLNMLDHTPEEVANESLSDEEFLPHSSIPYREYMQANSSGFSPDLKSQKDDLTDPTMISQLSLNGLEAPSSQLSQQASRDEASSWSPTWLGAEQAPNDPAEVYSVMQRPPAPHQASAHESDVGLYLP